MKVDTLIDRLVESVNHGKREPKWEGEVPVSLRLAAVDDWWFDWKIERSSRIDWIDRLEDRLPARYPGSFRSLITRYEYPAFSLGPVTMFANTAESVDYELREEIWKDKGLSEPLLSHGFLQFGRPSTGSYDPICFEVGESPGSQELEIVRLDHEELLCNSRIRVTERIAGSFFRFAEAQLALKAPRN